MQTMTIGAAQTGRNEDHPWRIFWATLMSRINQAAKLQRAGWVQLYVDCYAGPKT